MKDLSGKLFGRLTAIRRVGVGRFGHVIWECVCNCGVTKNVHSRDLIHKQVRSCGCLYRDTRATNLTHGASSTPEYRSWVAMVSRCTNPKNRAFKDYGSRGIKVCERWMNGPDAFISDMGLKPSQKHTLERKDNNGNYEPSNCVWATPREQSLNKRNTKMISIDGVLYPVVTISPAFGLNPKTVYSRLSRGWTDMEALSPVTHHGRLST